MGGLKPLTFERKRAPFLSNQKRDFPPDATHCSRETENP